MTNRYAEIEKLCPETQPEKAERYWAIRIQFMEDVYFAVELGRYPNAPDNRGWMNLFRGWSLRPSFDDHWKKLKGHYTRSFVAFCEDYIIGWGSIDDQPVPHPWDDTTLTRPIDGATVTGIYLDPGNRGHEHLVSQEVLSS